MPLPLDRPHKNELTIPCTRVTGEDFAALAAAPWWPELEFLDACFYELSKIANWRLLWSETPLALRELRLRFPDTQRAIEVIRGNLPKLRTLVLCGEIGDQFLKELSCAELPALEQLEIRKTNIQGQAVKDFVNSPRPGLPSLKQLGLAFSSDRHQDYTDWNGAIVGWGYEPMRDNELQYEFLRGSSLKLMPEIWGWPPR